MLKPRPTAVPGAGRPCHGCGGELLPPRPSPLHARSTSGPAACGATLPAASEPLSLARRLSSPGRPSNDGHTKKSLNSCIQPREFDAPMRAGQDGVGQRRSPVTTGGVRGGGGHREIMAHACREERAGRGLAWILGKACFILAAWRGSRTQSDHVSGITFRPNRESFDHDVVLYFGLRSSRDWRCGRVRHPRFTTPPSAKRKARQGEAVDGKVPTPAGETSMSNPLSKADFPSSLTLDITPSPRGPPINILILLHGLGDTQSAFTTLARNLNLPETACISLRGPHPIPALFTGSESPSFHWGDDVLVDESRGEIDLDGGFQTAHKVLSQVISVLTEKHGYQTRNILFLGFGQGGMAALSYISSTMEVGGIISIGGRLPAAPSAPPKLKNKTPVLVCGGSRSSQVTQGAIEGLKARFGAVEYVKWAKGGDSMPGNREEMLPIMKFLARRLRSRAGVPEGAVEV